ncbi:hypothetical protein [Gulosibacter sp. 10]|uniref:hypothetical protein n=1 Tax=Gulosibacter sp. 10 TaxID=1255570 RepID=UPI00097F1BEA|nr:hypothetical protein [Gulosibacter sp. 10]SJM66890.1 hypothetical protein FM112_12120 [Gulosibacter sp. 10]
MTKPSSKKDKSARRALMKPFEVVAISAGCGIFVLLVVLLTLQDWIIGLVFGGIAMVVVLLVLALVLLGYKPNPDVPVYLDRDLYESDEPGAKEASLRPVESYEEEFPREEDETEEGESGQDDAERVEPEEGAEDDGSSEDSAKG